MVIFVFCFVWVNVGLLVRRETRQESLGTGVAKLHRWLAKYDTAGAGLELPRVDCWPGESEQSCNNDGAPGLR